MASSLPKKSRLLDSPFCDLPLRINSDEVCSAKMRILPNEVHHGLSIVG
jgi:hypothetical protein